jgi:multiple sugar transport system permease protein
LNLGLGSAVSVLIFLSVLVIAFIFIRGFGVRMNEGRPGG